MELIIDPCLCVECGLFLRQNHCFVGVRVGDVVYHGRGETETEMPQTQTNPGDMSDETVGMAMNAVNDVDFDDSVCL